MIDESCFGVDGVGDGVEIVAVVAARNLAQLRARRAGDDGVDDEGALAGHRIESGGKQGTGENVQQVGGAGGND